MAAKTKILNCLKKRELLNKNGVEPQTLIAYGSSFFDLELYNDAIDFFEKAEYSEGIDKIKAYAIGEGDLFLYKRCCKALKSEEKKEELLQLAENAKSAGKLSFASQAYEEIGEKEKSAALRQKITPTSEVAGHA